jgi:quercetin dioxygenase-like cupin family protein
MVMSEENRGGEARREVPAGEAVRAGELVRYSEGSVVSRVLSRGAGGTVTVFAFDKGESVSEHTTPCTAVVFLLEGRAEFVIEERRVPAGAGDLVLIPAGAPHSVQAVERFKMLLVMLRG